MQSPRVRLVTFVLVAVLGAAACAGGSDQAPSFDSDSIPGAAASDAEPADAPEQAAPTTEPPLAPTPPPAAPESADETGDGLFPTVVAAMASTNDGSSWRFDVTLLSEYDSPARYADAWRVLDADDNELGIRVLGHDHANEQPFTRSTSVDIPAGTMTVFVEGRDQLNGWSGERFEVTLTP